MQFKKKRQCVQSVGLQFLFNIFQIFFKMFPPALSPAEGASRWMFGGLALLLPECGFPIQPLGGGMRESEYKGSLETGSGWLTGGGVGPALNIGLCVAAVSILVN